MRSIEMILMTRSAKYGGYCVAGFDCATGQWVRLTSDDEESHGALNDEMLYDSARRRCADVLDRVRVDVTEDVPGAVQVENVLIDGKDRIHIIERVRLEEALRLHPCEERDALFASHHYMVQGDVRALGHSLEMVCAEKIHVYTLPGAEGKPKYKVDFECGGHQYSRFAMTDPVYYGRTDAFVDKAAVILSISDDEWSRANGNYIYTAKILPIRSRRRIEKNGWRRALIAACLAAILAGLAAGSAAMGTVYVAPYSGARYHRTLECSELVNPQAAVEMPAVIGGILWKECGKCRE